MNEVEPNINDDDRKLLNNHYAFYKALDSKQRTPTTQGQSHFIEVCSGAASPETEHELAYSKFKQIISTYGYDEDSVVSSGFIFPIEIDDIDKIEDTGIEVDVPVRICDGCGRLISPRRLEILPEATRCIQCQQNEESSVKSNWHVSEIECPRCAKKGIKSNMIWRMAKSKDRLSGFFLGCSQFPDCRYINRS